MAFQKNQITSGGRKTTTLPQVTDKAYAKTEANGEISIKCTAVFSTLLYHGDQF
jgi:hypothetical protein